MFPHRLIDLTDVYNKTGILVNSPWNLNANLKEKPQTGLVIAIGDEEDDIPVKVGQKILFPKYTGTEIKLDGVEHLIIEASDLLAIIKE